MTIQFKIAKDSNGKVGVPGYTSDIIYAADLVANTPATVEVPFGIPAGSIPAFQKNTFYTLITATSLAENAVVWVCVNGVATIPATGVLTQTTSELVSIIPMGRIYQAGDILSFVTSQSDVQLCVTFYSNNGD